MKEYYNQFSGDLDEKAYESNLYVQRFWQRTKLRNVISFVPEDKVVVDVGGGSGVLAKLLGDTNAVVSSDISLKCVKNARKLDARTRGVVNDAMNLPYSDASADVVACVELIEHLTDPDKCLSEIQRILKPGGILVLTTPNYYSPWPVIEYLWDVFGKGRDYRTQHISKFHPSSISDTVSAKGFSVTFITTDFLLTPLVALIAPPLVKMLYRIEARLLTIIPLGMLITLTARKRA